MKLQLAQMSAQLTNVSYKMPVCFCVGKILCEILAEKNWIFDDFGLFTGKFA
jgi:hypothetical protein